MSVPHNCLINDIRESSALRGYTFSKYKTTDVKKQFMDTMLNGKIEPACYWCAELICGGHFMEVWETIIHYVGKHIHLGNPKILCYIEKRYDIFGTDGAKRLADALDVPFLGELPLMQTIREAGDAGRPAMLQGDSLAAAAFRLVLSNLLKQLGKNVE